MAQAVREALLKAGRGVEDNLISTLPRELKYTADQVKSIIETYKNSDINTIKNNLLNIKQIDRLIYYFAIISFLLAFSRGNIDNLIKIYSENFIKINKFSASSIRNIIYSLIDYLDKKNIENYTNKVLNILENLNRNNIYIWILKQKKIDRFENDIRRILFDGLGGPSADRGVKAFMRIFIDRNNIPLAYTIAYNDRELRKYKVHGDVYTSLVTLRSGAFEDIDTLPSQRLKQRIARELLRMDREGRYEKVKVRLRSIRGLVRSTAYLSGDPLNYEKGAYFVGRNYCSKLMCDSCPIREVCRKYIFIEIK